MLDEGYIKYQSRWSEAPAPDPAAAELLEEGRLPLFAAGIGGHYEELGIGFGNISIRSKKPRQFLISGNTNRPYCFHDRTTLFPGYRLRH